MFAWYESNLFFGNQSHDSHVWIDYIHLDRKKICRKDFACRNACYQNFVITVCFTVISLLMEIREKLWLGEGL